MSDAFAEKLASHLQNAVDQLNAIPGIKTTNRNNAILYPAVSRATTLISSVCAYMLTNGGMQVRDRDDNLVDTRGAKNVLMLFEGAPDGFTPAHTFWEDVISDYCLEGSGLIEITRVNGRVSMLNRLVPNSCNIDWNRSTGMPIYKCYRAFDYEGDYRVLPHTSVIHARIPILQRSEMQGNITSRAMFPQSPLAIIADAVSTGLKQNKVLLDWFKTSGRNTVHIALDTEDAMTLTVDQKKILKKAIETRMNEGSVVVTVGGEMKNVDTTPRGDDVNTIRQMMIEETARFYGLPLPLMSVPVGQWSRGINEQVMKMAWRTGFSTHFFRIEAALSNALLPKGHRFKADNTEFIRGDASGIAELIMATQGDAQRNPVASRAELRHVAGFPKNPEEEIEDTIMRVDPMQNTGGNSNER